LQGTAGATQPSQIFGDLQAGKSYVFDIFIWGIDESEGTALTLAIETVGVSLTLKPHWIISRSESYRDNVLKTERAFIAKVAINGSSTSSNYNLRVNVSTAYPIGASAAIALFGGFTSQLVGSVTVIPTT
jgi:hypothetical protein